MTWLLDPNILYLATSAKVQNLCMIIIASGLTLLFYIKVKRFLSSDPLPEINPLVPKRQTALSAETAIAKVGLFFKNFPRFDMINNVIVFDAILWFEFNPSITRLETLEKFSFVNGKTLQKKLINTKKKNGLVLAEYFIQVEITLNLDHTFFPINAHKIPFILTNESVSPDELIFQANESGFSWTKNIYTHDWNIIGKSVATSYSQSYLDRTDPKKMIANPMAVFILDISKAGIRQLSIILLPTFLLFFISLQAMLLNPEVYYAPILSLTALCVTGILAYRFVIEVRTPNVGYFTLSDHIYILVVANICFIFFTCVIQFAFLENPKKLWLIKSLIFYFLQAELFIFVYYFLFHWEKEKLIAPLLTAKRPRWVPKFTAISRVASQQFRTLQQLKKYAHSKEEYPRMDNQDWLNPDYTSFHTQAFQQQSTLQNLLQTLTFEKRDLWSPETFKTLLEQQVQAREQIGYYESNFITKLVPRIGSKFIIWGDLHGAFHSLVRDLEELLRQGILQEDLKLSSPDHYLVFNGNAIDRSPYVLETLTVVMRLMHTNPRQVFYIKGNHEHQEYWHNYQLRQELQLRARKLSNEEIPLNSLVIRFFATLPLALYLKQQDNYCRISHYGMGELGLKEELYHDFLTQSQVEGTFQVFELSNIEARESAFDLNIFITCEHPATKYLTTTGLELLPPEEGAITWSVFSSPTATFRMLFQYFYDAFAVLEIGESFTQSTITLWHQDVRELDGYTPHKFYALYGLKVDERTPTQTISFKKEVVLGCTLDLSQTSAILGKRLREGLHLGVLAINRQSQVLNQYLRLVVLNDKYTPHITKKNVTTFLNTYHTDLIFSPLGTPTTESLLPLVRDQKILILFPYTGANIFRKPDLDHFLHFRTSYATEAKALINYAVNDLELKKIALFYQDDSYGKAALEGAVKTLESLDIYDYLEAPYQRNNPNIDEAAAKIVSYNPNAIFFFSTNAPSVALVKKLGIENLTDKTFFGISFLTDIFRSFLQQKGLELIISRVVPDANQSQLEIVKEYRAAMDEYALGEALSSDSLEGYINTQILAELIKNTKGSVTKEKLIKQAEMISHFHFKGLQLNFEPQTRELTKDVWIDTGYGPWIKAI
jgi:ABC-type branched-subunit amino acid transport system substrate-binding protein